jgi:hypothetical protein
VQRSGGVPGADIGADIEADFGAKFAGAVANAAANAVVHDAVLKRGAPAALKIDTTTSRGSA